jgi:hypothetical protein
MLEIILIIFLAKMIGNIATEKGRNAAGYIVLFVLMWVGGEIVGAIIGVIISRGELSVGGYLFAILGAAVGAATAFMITSCMPSVEEDEYVPRRRRKRRWIRDEDDDYRPRKRTQRLDDADEDESYREKFRPRTRREQEDETYQERPRRRGRPRPTEDDD